MATGVDAIWLLRAAYLGASALILFVSAIPVLSSRFLDYGPRTNVQTITKGKDGNTNSSPSVLDQLARVRVPHSWFTSFYAVSVMASIFWASELLFRGPFFRQVLVTWAMMFAQGSRRLYECLVIAKPSSSQMWFGHWAIGIYFYLCTSLAVWVEGIDGVQSHNFLPEDLLFQAPNIKTFVGFTIFLLASGFQHDCHAYLASLKDPQKKDKSTKPQYRLPEHPAFNVSLTPHYFAECLIYVSLAIVAAPPGTFINSTMFCALVFVVVNLGVTARGTKKWYESKFGCDAVKGRARMIPGVY